MVKKLENRENKKLVPRETLETLLKVVPELCVQLCQYDNLKYYC